VECQRIYRASKEWGRRWCCVTCKVNGPRAMHTKADRWVKQAVGVASVLIAIFVGLLLVMFLGVYVEASEGVEQVPAQVQPFTIQSNSCDPGDLSFEDWPNTPEEWAEWNQWWDDLGDSVWDC
jgi:hypothetical protein